MMLLSVDLHQSFILSYLKGGEKQGARSTEWFLLAQSHSRLLQDQQVVIGHGGDSELH